MNDVALPLSGLSSVGGKSVVARFDGGMLSSNSGVLALAEVEKRLRVAERLARCIDDPRCPDQVVHSLADMIGFRMKMIAAGYEDGNDANRLRRDPVFKMAQDALRSGRDLASQSTLCRLENLPGVRELVAMGRAMVDLYCASFRQVPKRIVLDIDDTFDAVHGGQQLRLFNAHHDEYGFQPIVVFDGAGRFLSAILRPAKQPSGAEIRPHLRRLVRAIRINWPNIRILLRGDSHYCNPQVIDWCRANDVDFIFGLAPTTTLRKHVADLEASTTARFEASAKTGKVRRFKEFVDGARGAAENHIKSWKTHLAADRTSCTRATANQFRLFLHAGAYWLMWGLRAAMPRRSSFAVAQFDTLRLRLIKIAARVVEMKSQIRLHLPTSCPDQRILRIVLDRIPQLAT
ncbi:IS1380 family transposase [Mesorhizobium sp. M0684]|uniref:IS1380 family transposase n=1 Tax=Mesorhizobium sp. M0684 TaxID=2956986 RepID=UPI00333B41EA